MFSSDDLYSALNVSAITNLLDTYEYGEDSYPGLFDNMVIPSFFTGTKVINFYMSGVYDARLDYDSFRYTINCRSQSYSDSRTIANTVLGVINRTIYDDYFIVCEMLPTISPQDTTDVYNTPIEAVILKK